MNVCVHLALVSDHVWSAPVTDKVSISESMRLRTHVYWTFFLVYYYLLKYSILFNTLYTAYELGSGRVASPMLGRLRPRGKLPVLILQEAE